MNQLQQFKNRLARIRPGSFRYQMTKGIWKEHRIKDVKACSFYWWYLPSSVLAWLVVGVAFVLWCVLISIIILISWVFGFTFEQTSPDPDKWTWHDYGYNPVTKQSSPIAYQHILLSIAGIVTLLIFRKSIQWMYVFSFIVGIVLAVGFVALIGYIVTRKATKEAWHRICPPLEVMDQ